jgi:glutathione S-transferase
VSPFDKLPTLVLDDGVKWPESSIITEVIATGR